MLDRHLLLGSSVSDPLATPEQRQTIWATIARTCWDDWKRRPWRTNRLRAAVEAGKYAFAADPPRDWPNGNPAMKERW
jgi:hypothetical protein